MIPWLRSRCVHVVVEQPLNSILFDELMGSFQSGGFHRFTLWLGAFGGESCKPLELWLSLDLHLVKLHLAGSRSEARKALGNKKVSLAKVSAKSSRGLVKSRWAHKSWVIGVRGALKASQEYPVKFAEAVAQVLAATMA